MPSEKSQRILLAALALTLMVAGLFAYGWRQADSRRQQTLRWTHFVMDSLGTTLNLPRPPEEGEVRDTIYWQWIATAAQLQSRRWARAVRYWVELRSTLLDDVDIADLKREGLENPPKQLRESLISHAELIPFQGIQGGTMAFVPDERIVLLKPPYVFAEFEDGHIGGSILVEYTVPPGPQIQWKRLWAAPE